MEEWKIIEGCNGVYSVSNMGRVKNNKKNRLLKQSMLHNGYLAVHITEMGKLKYYRVHRLVGKYFVDGYQKEKQINHKDGNKTNNKHDNLEWVTPSQNIKHAFSIGLKTVDYSNIKNPKAVKQYSMNGEFIKEYPSIKDAERHTGIDNSAIAKVCKGKYKSSGGFKWQYAT